MRSLWLVFVNVKNRIKVFFSVSFISSDELITPGIFFLVYILYYFFITFWIHFSFIEIDINYRLTIWVMFGVLQFMSLKCSIFMRFYWLFFSFIKIKVCVSLFDAQEMFYKMKMDVGKQFIKLEVYSSNAKVKYLNSK